ncbi:LacI family DNA-binding transcriptional regulator [Pontibacter silvestris]|uniref:LacI family DNA-binding transcriptional regulator n=1 Tax=Pontibacter silvestris TaxID=2305183 RepID=A0ABW4X2T6_9BACT|nr:LacI family DNA-binding transcriptional regulator [Pontibacter silvestris]MCC9136037.1 LacI family transcriptional regulator [Pontibacter silvestris]
MSNRSQHTIKDIAVALGLSASTVSRALNDHPHISQETKQRVREAVEKLDYRRNALAANLRTSKSNIIGLIVPRISMFFLSSVITAIQNKLHEFGYNLMVCQSNDSQVLEKELVNAMYASRVDGLIVSATLSTEDFSHFDIFSRRNIPLVFFDRIPRNYPAHKIQGDDYQGGYQTTLHLLEQGCRRIAFICGPLTSNLYQDRYAGYQNALKKYAVAVDEQIIFFHELSKGNALKDCDILFAQAPYPDAVFACNDTSAIAVVEHAKAKQIKVPEVLKVAGYSNDPRTQIIDPAITSVEQFPLEVGTQAAALVMDLIQQKTMPGRNFISLTTPVDLVKRTSSGA